MALTRQELAQGCRLARSLTEGILGANQTRPSSSWVVMIGVLAPHGLSTAAGLYRAGLKVRIGPTPRPQSAPKRDPSAKPPAARYAPSCRPERQEAHSIKGARLHARKRGSKFRDD
jgi:hypothetical protein